MTMDGDRCLCTMSESKSDSEVPVGEHETVEHFKLSSREEIETFEALIQEYAKTAWPIPNHISLVTAFDSLQGREDGGRIFTALLDLYLSFVFLYYDMCEIGGTWNKNFSKGKLEGGSILDDSKKFVGKMKIHRFATSYVLRYRALWDKLMGLMVLVEVPSAYDTFCGATKKKKSFTKIAKDKNLLPEQELTDMIDGLAKFDEKFRTGEAHGVGALRKWTLTMVGVDQNPQIELIGYWNVANLMIKNLMVRYGFMPNVPVSKT